MNPDQLNDMTPEEAKASLGISTSLMDQIMPMHAEPQAPQEEMPNTEPEKPSLRDQYPQEENTELADIKEEISMLREEIKEVLEEEVTNKEDEEPKASEPAEEA